MRLVQRNTNLLSRENFIRILNHFAVRLKDAIVFVRVAVELLGDLGQIVARLNDVVFNFLLLCRSLHLGSVNLANSLRWSVIQGGVRESEEALLYRVKKNSYNPESIR